MENETASLDGRFAACMASLPGMISLDEAQFLRRAAAEAQDGCIVEIGSWRGKSAVAMALGLESRPLENRPLIYCVDPHRPFVGIYGGRFGAEDRKGFYETMLASGCAERVALINLPSGQVAESWREPIALLFIDGDHSYDGVRQDVAGWFPFLTANAVAAFDDALDINGGPYRVIAELIGSGAFEPCGKAGKIAAIRQRSP
jgi:hypothetical protein